MQSGTCAYNMMPHSNFFCTSKQTNIFLLHKNEFVVSLTALCVNKNHQLYQFPIIFNFMHPLLKSYNVTVTQPLMTCGPSLCT